MCGIAGWIDLKEDLTDKYPIVEAMSATLAKRGPDSSGTWFSTHALLAHRRLAVMDPAGGAQPMLRQKEGYDYCIVYNGELYNSPELKKSLEDSGYTFTTSCDTEVLLLSYAHWGPQCVERLNGIFAFGIWDEKEQKIFLARDHFGVKPLFYTCLKSGLVFGSEIKTLLSNPMVKPEIGVEGLSEVFGLGPAKTPGIGVFNGISELKPAHCMIFDSNGLHTYRYWTLKIQEHTDSLEDTVSKVRGLVMDAMERQFVSDVPLCTFLSGGLDSSAITALAARYFRNNGKGRLHTYSIDYADNEKYFVPSLFQPTPDAPWVKRMADECGSEHTYFTVNTTQVADALENAVAARDLPGMADIDSSLWLFCQEVKKDATVALSGECADEVFGGYPWFHKEEMLNSGTFPWSRNIEERNVILSGDLLKSINTTEYIARRYQETLSEVPHMDGENELEKRRREMFYLNFSWFMQTLLDRKDRMSMAHGLEVRVPYCDYRLVQYAWNIPWDMKMLDGREKGLLRKAFEGVLPNDVLYRKKSPYPKTHNPSYEATVKNRLKEIMHDPNSPLLPLIDKKALAIIMAKPSDLGKPWYGQLMARPQLYAWLIQVNAWLRMYKISIKT
jgi:asparagine synthase (glutamine-hydrolysing)